MELYASECVYFLTKSKSRWDHHLWINFDNASCAMTAKIYPPKSVLCIQSFLFCLFSLFCHHCGCAELASSVPMQTVFDTQQLGLKNCWFDGKWADLKSTSAGIPKQRPNWIAGHCKPVFVLIIINQKLSLMYTLYYKMNGFNLFRNKSLITSSVALESTHQEVSTILLF